MSDAPGATRSPSCPICGKAADEGYRPFCSKRCADIDLGRWFSGGYAIAGRADDETEGTGPGTEAASDDERPADVPKRR